jgi:hypothetical protein
MDMGIFGRAFWGGAFGKLIVTILLALLATLGFGVDWWVRIVASSWGSNPADATIVLLRIVGALIGIACICVIALPYFFAAWRPRKFSVSFDPRRDVDAAISQFNTQTGQQLPNKCTYAHIHVESVGGHVTPCTGAIISLEKLDETDKAIKRLVGTRQLIWGPREHRQFQQIIAPHLPQDLDLFRTIEGVDKLEVLSVGHQQLWLDFFDLPGRYRITVAVHGDSRTETIQVTVDWRGKWNDFDAK